MENTQTSLSVMHAAEAEVAALCGKIRNAFMANGRQYRVKGVAISTKLHKGTVDVSDAGVRIHNARLTDTGLLSVGYRELRQLADQGSALASSVLDEVHAAFEGIKQRVASIEQSMQYATEAANA